MCIATMKSMTQAMRARAALEARGVRCEIVSLDPSLTRRGCGYGVRFSCVHKDIALAVLEAKRIGYGTVIGEGEGTKR